MFKKSSLCLFLVALMPIISCNKKVKTYHSNYGGYCSECGEVINGLHFAKDTVKKMPGGGYPRIIRLKNGNLLYGCDFNGGAGAFISADNGETWSDGVTFSLFEDENYSKYYKCTNADLIQLDNGDVIASYRSVPNKDAIAPFKYDYSLRSSISHDGGHSWEFFAKIASTNDQDDYPNQDKVKQIIDTNANHGGLWEPFAYHVNDKVLSYYSDDFGGWYDDDSAPLDHEFQYLCCKELDFNNKKWINRKICINGLKIKSGSKLPPVTSRDGMPVVAKMKDGTFVMAFEGTYYRNFYNHPFITLLSHSTDGITWSNPVEIYRPYGEGTKSGAAYIDVTDDNRLVVAFQTEEDYQEHGGEEMGEPHSITKVMISDGTPVNEIDRSCFYTAQDVFHEDLGISKNSLWPMVAVEGDYVYAFSGGKMNYSKIGKINDINSYHPTVNLDDCTKKSGELMKLSNGYYRSNSSNTFYLKNNFSSSKNKTFSVHLFPRIRNECGVIFNYYNDNFYTFTIGENRGQLKLTRVRKNESHVLATNDFIRDTFTYDPNNFYEMKISIVNNKTIECYINDIKQIEFTDNDFVVGDQVGYMANKVGTVFSDFYVK